MRKSTWIAIAALVLLALPLHAVDPEDVAVCSSFGYEPANGPNAWGTLKPEWVMCDSGLAQSPIHIDNMTGDQSLPSNVLHYSAGPFAIQNTSHEYKFFPLYKATLERGGVTATVVQVHFHHQAEHSIGNQLRSPMEMHIVHQLADKSYLVIAVLFVSDNSARPNAELQKIIDAKADLPACRSRKTAETVRLNLADLLVSRNHYAQYSGSLTTPPCSEPVKFVVLLEGTHVPESQIKSLRLAHENRRPEQPRLGRRIFWRQTR
jgi:carbonic anhydrase